ncbi:MAG: SDR family oxidoreductase [Pirellulales bacterium]|nr:SDR family oxidoreductase [Pirellulales bacterium]
MEIQGKAAIVTGGGTGVGRAVSLMLAERGCSVVINYSKSRDEAEATAAEVEKLGVRGIAVQADVAGDEACRKLVQTAVDACGGLHVLVNNAGTTEFLPHNMLDEITDPMWERILAVNLKGPFQCTRAAREPMLAAGGGAVVNVSSVAGIIGVGSSIPYACSKAALNNLTIMLARVLAPQIRVNGVAPGFIAGRWLEQGLGPMYEPMKKHYEKRLPLGRVCEPEDVAAAVMSLIVGSDMITGQTIVVDSGMTILAP